MKNDQDYTVKQILARPEDIVQLEMLVFQFTQLSKRLSHDREHWVETGKNLSNVVEQLNKLGQQYLILEQRFTAQAVTVIRQESKQVAINTTQAFSHATEQVLSQQIKVNVDYLNKAVHHTSNVLGSYQQEMNRLKTWFLTGIIFSSLFGNIIAGVIVYYLLLCM